MSVTVILFKTAHEYPSADDFFVADGHLHVFQYGDGGGRETIAAYAPQKWDRAYAGDAPTSRDL